MDTHPGTSEKPLSVEEALSHAPYKAPLEPAWKVFLSLFVVYYFFVVVAWLLPDDWANRDQLTEKTWPHMVFFGWFQHWSLFSPDVRHIIYHETAVISFADGSTKVYEFPRMQRMDLWEKFRHEKLRKMFSDNIPWDGYKQFLPYVARYIARANSNPENQPVQVTFIFNSTYNPPPDPESWSWRDRPLPHTDKKITFVYDVTALDLQEELDGKAGALRKEADLAVVPDTGGAMERTGSGL